MRERFVAVERFIRGKIDGHKHDGRHANVKREASIAVKLQDYKEGIDTEIVSFLEPPDTGEYFSDGTKI